MLLTGTRVEALRLLYALLVSLPVFFGSLLSGCLSAFVVFRSEICKNRLFENLFPPLFRLFLLLLELGRCESPFELGLAATYHCTLGPNAFSLQTGVPVSHELAHWQRGQKLKPVQVVHRLRQERRREATVALRILLRVVLDTLVPAL